MVQKGGTLMSRPYVWLVVGVAFLGAAPTFGQVPPRTDLYGDPLPAGAIARMGSTRFHLAGGVLATAFDPDGKNVMVVGRRDDGVAVRFWDVTTGKETARFTAAQRTWVNFHGAMLSPDGKVVALSCGRFFKLYDRHTGKFLRTLGGQYENRSFAFSPDGKLLVGGSTQGKEDNPIRAWEVDTGDELASFTGSGASLDPLTFSADGKQLFSGPITYHLHNNGIPLPAAICVWDVATRKKLRESTATPTSPSRGRAAGWRARTRASASSPSRQARPYSQSATRTRPSRSYSPPTAIRW
jgi:WD40 repeat protein